MSFEVRRQEQGGLERIMRRLSLKRRIFFLFFALNIVSLIASAVVIWNIATAAIIEKVTESYSVVFNTMNERLESSVSDIDHLTRTVFFDQFMLDALRQENMRKGSLPEELRRRIQVNLTNIVNLKHYISSITIITANGTVLDSYEAIDFDPVSANAAPLLAAAADGKGRFLWFGFWRTRIGTQVVLAGRALLDPSDLLPLGTMVVGIRIELLESIYRVKEGQAPYNPYVFLVDRGTIFPVSAQASALLEPFGRWLSETQGRGEGAAGSVAIGGKSYLVLAGLSDGTGVAVYSLIPNEAARLDIDRISFLISVVLAASGLFVLAFAVLISAGVTKPLDRLLALMSKVPAPNGAGVQDVSEFTGPDEFGRLFRRYDEMVLEIGALIDRVRTEQEEHRRAELRALQAQIHPHFLYNTLASIHWACRMNKNSEAATMASSLSSFFDLSLNKGKDTTTVARELEHARSYICIQSFRYQDTFNYVFEADPALAGLPVLKLILQPLVENAIIHGLAEARRHGRLRIECFEREGQIIFRVMDDGIGLEGFAGPGAEGYGLRNIADRLRVFYGDRGALRLFREGDWTISEVSVPKTVPEGAGL
jgi:two-component system sensor histidine kinase YesM